MNLQAIHQLLLAEPFEAIYEPADDKVPAERITIRLTIDDLPGHLYLQLMLVRPDVDDSSGTQDVFKLQYFTAFPIRVGADSAAQLVSYLPFLNHNAPIIGFNYNPHEQLAYFRHTALLPDDASAYQAIVATTWLIYYTLDQMAGEVAALAMGQATVAELLQDEEE